MSISLLISIPLYPLQVAGKLEPIQADFGYRVEFALDRTFFWVVECHRKVNRGT